MILNSVFKPEGLVLYLHSGGYDFPFKLHCYIDRRRNVIFLVMVGNVKPSDCFKLF